MRYFILAAALGLSACAGRPVSTPQPQSTPIAQSPQVSSVILGLTAAELIQRLGMPVLQVREGAGLKLQFRGRGCVLDAYLYRPVNGPGVERVTHVDTRLQTGVDTPQAACIAALQGA